MNQRNVMNIPCVLYRERQTKGKQHALSVKYNNYVIHVFIIHISFRLLFSVTVTSSMYPSRLANEFFPMMNEH